jgi:hypothetical protein
MSELIKQIDEVLDQATTLGGTKHIDCEQLLRHCREELEKYQDDERTEKEHE